MTFLVYGTYFLIMGLIVLWDLRSGKIPNVLLVSFLIINFFFVESMFDSSKDLSQAFGGMLVQIGYALVMTVFLFPFFSVGALGAGDVKLIAVASLGVTGKWLFLFEVFLVAAVLGIGKLAIVGRRKTATVIHLSVPVFAVLIFSFVLNVVK